MPCMCWYHPDEPKLREFKSACQAVANLVRQANKFGDPIGMDIDDAHKLIDHLYKGKCDEQTSS